MEGRFNGGGFALPVWGAYIWRGLFLEFYGIFDASSNQNSFVLKQEGHHLKHDNAHIDDND